MPYESLPLAAPSTKAAKLKKEAVKDPKLIMRLLPYRGFATCVAILLSWLVLVTATYFLITQHPTHYKAAGVFASIVFFLVGAIIWYLYLWASKAVTKGEPSLHDYLAPSENLWIWILIIGLVGALLTFVTEKDYKDFAIGPEYQYLDFIDLIITKRGLTVFSVVMASMLADFVLTLLRTLKETHTRVELINGQLIAVTKGANEASAAASKAATIINNTSESLTASVSPLLGGVDQLVGANHLLDFTTGKLREVAVDIDKKQDELTRKLERVESQIIAHEESQTREKELFEELTDKNKKENKALREIFDPIIHVKMLNLRNTVCDSLIKYAKSTWADKFFPSLLAATALSSLIEQIGPGKKLKDEDAQPNDLPTNFAEGNYAVFSSIVDAIYSKYEKILTAYREIRNDPQLKMVYFTTLTISIGDYLDAENWLTIPSMRRSWDRVRTSTQKAPYGRHDRSLGGHMWRFFAEPENLEFRRCCLWLNNSTVADRQLKDAISTYDQWKRDAKGNDWSNKLAGVLHVPNSANSCMEWLVNNDYELTGLELKRYYSQPDYLDLAQGDHELMRLDSANKPKVPEVFLRLYHPNPEDCRYCELSPEEIMKMLKNDESLRKMQAGFSDSDKLWGALIKRLADCLKLNQRPDDNLTIVDPDSDRQYYWYEIFFNRHIPVDMFAVGVRPSGEQAKIEWLGCLGGYVGGDFNSMLLAWHDPITSPDQWGVLEVIMSYLYEGDELVRKSDFEEAFGQWSNHANFRS
jgi:hypothetical protein